MMELGFFYGLLKAFLYILYRIDDFVYKLFFAFLFLVELHLHYLSF